MKSNIQLTINKGYITLFLFIFLLSTVIKAQAYSPPRYENISKFQVIDTAYLKCTYKLTYIKDVTKLKEKSIDIQTLMIGKNTSKYFSQYKFDHYKFVKEYLKTHDNYLNNREEGTWSFEFYKNYPKDKETVADIGSILQANFLYEEGLPKFQWKLFNEKQDVVSYHCYKATTTFRGRDYIAWYTKEIPVNNGPWKFSGLPGLILKIYDTKEQFVFECKGLEKLKVNEPIKFYTVDYTKTNRKDLEKLYSRIHRDYAGYLRAVKGIKVVITKKNGEEDTHASLKLPYNPIELE